MITSTITWTDSITVGVTKHIVYRDDIKLGEVPIGDPAIWYDPSAVEGITYKYEVQAVAGVEESTQEVVSVNIFNITIPNEVTVVLQTTSTSNAWTPNNIVNSGNILVWEVTGDVTPIAEETINIPTFDLSSNIGTAIITIKSTTAFTGFTELGTDFLLVSSANVLAATDLTVLSIKGDYALSSLDISTLVNLTTLVCRTELLTTIDLSNNILLDGLFVYANNLNGIDISNNPLLTEIYIGTNDIPTIDLDAVINDADAAGLSNGTIDMLGNTGNLTQAAQPAYNNLIGKGWIIDAAAPSVTPTGVLPVLSNFHKKDTDRDRIYFDSSSSISGMTSQGFITSNNTILGITVIGTSTTGHYLTVGTSYNYWNNNTVRLTNGDGTVFDFDLQYITNNIVQPPTNSTKFVAVGASGTGDTVGDPMVWSDAQSVAAGTKVYWEKGDYGAINFVQATSGTLSLPIVHEGYDITPGDSPSLAFTPTLAFDANVMPYINSGSGSGFSLGGRDYIIVKNIQVEGYASSIDFGGASNYCILDNVYAKGSTTYSIDGFNESLIECRVINSFAGKSNDHCIRIAGERPLLDNVYACSNGVGVNDYYISLYGSRVGEGEGIIRNCTVIRDPLTTHEGHGISLRGNSPALLYNALVEDCTIDYVASAIELRTELVKNCVVRNVVVNNYQMGGVITSQAVRITGSVDCIIDNITAIDCNMFVQFVGSTEAPTEAPDAGNGNIFKNCLGYQTGGWEALQIVRTNQDGNPLKARTPQNTKFLNCTFNDYERAIYYQAFQVAGQPDVGNEFINSIIRNVTAEEGGFQNEPSNWSYTNNDLYNSFTAPNGSGNIDVDPQFVDLIDFVPQEELIRIGLITSVHYDSNDAQRFEPSTVGAVITSGEPGGGYVITTSYLNLIENNESEALNNANKLIVGINTYPEGIDVNGIYFIQTPSTSLTSTDIRLSSTGGELKSNETLTTLFTSVGIENIEVDGVTFSDVYSGGGDLRLFHDDLQVSQNVELVKFNNNTFNGNIYIYKTTTASTFDPNSYAINNFTFSNNYISNNRKTPVFIRNYPLAICNIIGNTLRNVDNTVFDIAITNAAIYEKEMFWLRPLITITDNDLRNDVDFECAGSETIYQSLVVLEADQVDYLRNHVEGIWTTSNLSVYDAYLSCNTVNYKNNTNKNNVKFNAVISTTNVLMKSKGAAEDVVVAIRNYWDNHFIVEESWIDQVVLEGANKDYSSVTYAQTGVDYQNKSSSYIKNNTFDVYSMVSESDNYIHAVNYEISGNTFNLTYFNNIFTEIIEIDDNTVADSVIFSDNIMSVLNRNETTNVAAMVKVVDNRTTNTDKIGSVVINNNSGTIRNYMLYSRGDADYFEMIGNSLVLNPDLTTISYALFESYSEESSISNNEVTYNNGEYFIGTNRYSATSVINESITFNGTPSQGYEPNMVLAKGQPSAPNATYRRTFNADSGDEIYYFEFTLSYNTDHWEVSFTDTGDTPRTFIMNNDDAVSDGHDTYVKVINSGVGNTATTIRFKNGDDQLGFRQEFTAGTDIQLNVITVKT